MADTEAKTTTSKKLSAPDVAKELNVKPAVLRAWLRANGYQTQPGASYSFTRAEATKLKKAYEEAAAKPKPEPAKRGRKAKAVEQPEPVPAEDITDDVPDDEDDLDLDDDVISEPDDE